jgi:hypothetical protein
LRKFLYKKSPYRHINGSIKPTGPISDQLLPNDSGSLTFTTSSRFCSLSRRKK